MKHAFVPKTYLAKCRKFIFPVSPFFTPSSIQSLIRWTSSSSIQTFFLRSVRSIQFRFIPNFSIYPFDNGESWREGKNLFVQCKRINRSKQYNIFHIFSWSLSCLFSRRVLHKTKCLPLPNTHTNHNTFDAQQQKTDYQYSNKSEK